MDVQLLRNGGTTWQERLEDALRRADIALSSYKRGKGETTRALIAKRLLMPLYVDLSQTYGERWLQLFRFIANTEEHQTVSIARNQFFPPMDDLSLPKRWYLLHAKRWQYGRENLSVREALEAKLGEFELGQVQGVDDVPTGLDFAGVSANSHIKVTTPYNWLRAEKMSEALESQPAIFYEATGKRPTLRLQFGREDLSQAFETGIRVVAEDIPSLSGEQTPHKVTVTNLPVYNEREGVVQRTKRRGYDLFTSDDCMRNVFSDDKFSRKIKGIAGRTERTTSENEVDHHTIVTILLASDLVSQQYPGLAVDNPIPKVPKGVEELVEVTFRRIRAVGIRNDERMLWESTALMQIYTMMAIAYLNTRKMQEQKNY